MSETLVTLSNATIGYNDGPVLSGVNISVERGDFWAVVGPNGSGKTTLLRAVMGTMGLQSGERHVASGVSFGYVPQRQALDPLWPLTALEVVEMGVWRRRPGRRTEALAALEAVGAKGIAQKLFRELSGGQKQRVLLSRALLLQPKVLMLDEPTGDLDVRGQKEMQRLLQELHREELTILMVTHDLHQAAAGPTRVAILHEGRAHTGPPERLLSAAQLQTIYGTTVPSPLSARPSAPKKRESEA